MASCGINNNNLKNMDNSINVIMLNHKDLQCDSKWTICYALAVSEPSETPGSNSKGKEILLNQSITKHWWWHSILFLGRQLSNPPNESSQKANSPQALVI